MSWISCLVNPPGEDPALLISPLNSPASVLIDCGDLRRLPLKELLKIRHVLISHTHIDHFVGFDSLLRSQLFSSEPLTLYGPPGLATQVAGKLAGYAWNLVEDSPFRVEVCELHGPGLLRTTFWCRQRFVPNQPREDSWNKLISENIELDYAQVVHNVPCLAYRLTWPGEMRIDKQALKATGRAPGPWLQELKQNPESNPEMAARLVLRQAPRSLAYVTDTVWNKTSARALHALCQGAEELWCEACYLHSQLAKAREHLHLTARQAGRLAAEAGVGKLHLFHFSRRYQGGEAHLEEARQFFSATEPGRVYFDGPPR
ncbi:hypothetical protein DYH09_26375 [bacterium CPR1]|nr:hypothetical protein [bacterium CPR1]